MPEEISAVCVRCQRVTVTLPMPDAWETPDGERREAVGDEADVEAMQAWLQTMPCPRCQQLTLRITLPPGRGGTDA